MTNKPSILIIGSGISGMMAALNLIDKGYPVVLVSESHPFHAKSVSFHGGLDAVVEGIDDRDSIDLHVRETLMAGEDLADPQLVREMCEAAPGLLFLMQRMGLPLDGHPDGYLWAMPSEQGVMRRNFSAGSYSGRAVGKVLYRQIAQHVAAKRLRFETGLRFISLLRDQGGVNQGALFLRYRDLDFSSIVAPVTVLATGGVGQFLQQPNGGRWASIDAAAIAFRQGVDYANPEFFQLHPATLHLNGTFIPLTTPLKRRGARYSVMRQGRPWFFLESLYQDGLDQLPYLVMARAFAKVMKDPENVAGHPIHCRCDSSNGIRDELDQLMARMTGIDWYEMPVEVFPSLQENLGGFWVDRNLMTKVGGLFAVGDCQYQFHGANAIEGNQLMASLFSGLKVAQSITHYLEGMPLLRGVTTSLWEDLAITKERERLTKLRQQSGKETLHALMQEVHRVMGAALGIARDNQGLTEAIDGLEALRLRAKKVTIQDTGSNYNHELLEALFLDERLQWMQMVLAAALERNESRGTHYKPAFPKRDDIHFRKITRARYRDEGAEIGFELVSPVTRNLDVASVR